MKNQRILLPYLYALITIVCTFLVGQLILWFCTGQHEYLGFCAVHFS